VSPIRAVAFDIGETLLDRTREYAAWAHRLGVPPHTFSAVFGAMIAQGAGVRDVVEFMAAQQGVPVDLSEVGDAAEVTEADLYPDVRASLAALQKLGLYVLVAGNQPSAVGAQLRGLELPADLVVSSQEWDAAKPDPAFFQLCATAAGCEMDEVVYVGDQLDNDVRAPLEAGMQSVRIRRGPWGYLTHDDALESRCLAVINSLDELPGRLTPQLA
jgi:HAD superfamily hydrolase (TIGR01549 family)